MGFWVALASATTGHPRVVGSEVQLSPAPTSVVYPEGVFGELLATADGRQIVQQGSRDSRIREWHWANYPGFLLAYERQFQFLQSLRSRYRREAGTGVSPFVYIKDDTTRLLRRRVQVAYTVSGTGASSITVSGSPGWTTNALKDAVIEVLPATAGGSGTGAYQTATVVSNGASTLNTLLPWTTAPTGARVLVSYYDYPWFRCRVLEVDRKLIDQGGNIRYSDSWMKFVVDEDGLNLQPDLG